jgi:hypothetical protein
MKGFIYEIVCNLTNERYVGSTTNLNLRKSQHKNHYNSCSSSRIIERGNYTFNILEEVVFENKIELLSKEREYIQQGNCINSNIPFLTKEELNQYNKDYNYKYYHSHKEERKELKSKIDKEYYEKNRLKLLTKMKCECGSEYIYCSKSRHLKTKKHLTYAMNENVIS